MCIRDSSWSQEHECNMRPIRFHVKYRDSYPTNKAEVLLTCYSKLYSSFVHLLFLHRICWAIVEIRLITRLTALLLPFHYVISPWMSHKCIRNVRFVLKRRLKLFDSMSSFWDIHNTVWKWLGVGYRRKLWTYKHASLFYSFPRQIFSFVIFTTNAGVRSTRRLPIKY